MFSGDCRGTVETQKGQTAVLGASPGCSSGACPEWCGARSGAAGGLFHVEISSANSSWCLAGTARCGEGTPREGAMRFPSDLRADPLLPEEMLIVSPSASASGAGSRSCLLMLPGRWGSLPLQEKTLNQIDYVMESWLVFPTEKHNVFGKQGESPPANFPAPSGSFWPRQPPPARPG